jgi:hypothetical protein
MARGVILWILWKERNRLIFQMGNCKSIRHIGGDILILLKYYSQIKGQNYIDNLYLIILPDVNNLPMQIIEEPLSIVSGGR